jgi:hypothetical protein
MFKLIKALALCVSLSALLPSAHAETFDFANLTYSNASYAGFLPNGGFNCSSGDKCSSNISSSLGGSLSFTSGSISAVASASYNGSAFGTMASVVQDHDNGYNGLLSGTNAIGAGLGVYHLNNNNADDNITNLETLKLHFNQSVALSAIGLRSDGHNTTKWSTGDTFQYSFDNTTWNSAVLPKNVGQLAMSQNTQDLYLRFGGSNANQFYLSSVTVAAVPEPETYALMLAGLGVLGWTTRRKQAQKAQA